MTTSVDSQLRAWPRRDPSVSIAERHGGRFLTREEAGALSGDSGALQYVEMNLRALWEADDPDAPPMTEEELGILCKYADDARSDAETRLESAQAILAHALQLFSCRNDAWPDQSNRAASA